MNEWMNEWMKNNDLRMDEKRLRKYILIISQRTSGITTPSISLEGSENPSRSLIYEEVDDYENYEFRSLNPSSGYFPYLLMLPQ